MSLAIYNVDKPYPFDRLVIITIASPDVIVYGEEDAEDIGISGTSPEFLGRLRKVTHEGKVAKNSEVFGVSVPQGSQIAIDTNGNVRLLIGRSCYGFAVEEGVESMVKVEFDPGELGEFGEYLTMTEDNLDKFLDSYKKPKPANKGRKGKSTAREVEEMPDVEDLSF